MKLEPSEVFKILGVESRIKIVELLKTRGSMGVNDLAELLGITPAAVSQHLKVLRHAGLVTSERRGYCIPYSLDEEALESCRCLVNEVCSCGCYESLEPLERFPANLELAELRAYETKLKLELQKIQEEIAALTLKNE